MTERTFTAEDWAAQAADWVQVVQNGGPPCFRLMADGRFCLRAERWPGHGEGDHQFMSLADLLAAAHERETALREELDGIESALGLPPAMRPHSISALKIINAKNQAMDTAEAALAEAQREIARLAEDVKAERHRSDAFERDNVVHVAALTAERQKVQELREWHEGWIAILSRPKARSADNVVQKQAHLTALEKLDALGLTDADRAVGKRG